MEKYQHRLFPMRERFVNQLQGANSQQCVEGKDSISNTGFGCASVKGSCMEWRSIYLRRGLLLHTERYVS